MRPASVSDYRELARRRLPRVLFDYIDGGSYAEATLAANVDDLNALTLRQRVMRDVSRLSMQTELFGQTLSMPVVLAPVGLSGMYARRGETQAARAAKAAGVPFSLSTVGVCTIEEVAAAAGTAPWFQLYMIKDRGFMAQVLERASAAGCPALLFTVDLPMPGARYRDTRNGMIATNVAQKLSQAIDGLAHPGWLWDVQLNGGPHTLGNVAGAAAELRTITDFWAWIGRNFDPSVTWDDIAWVRERWKGPIILKGVLDVEDAAEAVARGVDGIVVSNHGGRQLDGVASGIAALPRIAEAVGDRLTILMDGGVRSGLDVLKALASGAQACLIGRAWAWSLGARGEAGVGHMLQILRGELRMAMALTGCTDVRAAGPHLLDR
ncbi:L-lactate dehydrogenase [Caulobacter sp. KR2-114]|uniref:L-lactate dehydrogenase n=1 Tax=Caulobacter sp. KR2-114 TaxID=3400912 RepID=UPI003C07BA8F